jgi:hypothetical protein
MKIEVDHSSYELGLERSIGVEDVSEQSVVKLRSE